MSGTAYSFIGPSPLNAALLAYSLTKYLKINTTNADEIFIKLLTMSAADITDAATMILDERGIMNFNPVIESIHDNINAVLPDDIDRLIEKDNAMDVPKILGFTENEAISFRKRFEDINILKTINEMPTVLVPLNLIFKLSEENILKVIHMIKSKYFSEEPSMDEFIRYCSDIYFKYPILKVAEKSIGNVYLYKFSYHGNASSILQDAGLYSCNNTTFCNAAGHMEDLLYIFEAHSGKVFYGKEDITLKNGLTTLFSNFVKYG